MCKALSGKRDFAIQIVSINNTTESTFNLQKKVCFKKHLCTMAVIAAIDYEGI